MAKQSKATIVVPAGAGGTKIELKLKGSIAYTGYAQSVFARFVKRLRP